MTALVLIVAAALIFSYTNGFHDAANAVAAAVSTKALPLRAALILGAVCNLVGALLSSQVAATVAGGVITPPVGDIGVAVVLAAILGAVVWNLSTWYFGLPSSSSHALIGGLVGAGLVSATSVHWSGVVDKVILPMVLSPVVGLVAGYLLMTGVLWLLRRANAHRVRRGFRHAQIASATALALGHGLQDAQKSMGAVVLGLVVTARQTGYGVPLWATLACAGAMALGTYSGGLRIIRTLGRKIFPLTPPHGFVAEVTAATVLYLTAFVFTAPISTTHVITSGIMGVGATSRPSAVRWATAGSIVVGWVLTLPAAGLTAAVLFFPLHALLG